MSEKGWVHHLSIFPNSIPVFLVGNKVDLRKQTNEGSDDITDNTFVSTEEGKAVADSLGWGFVETSAFSNTHISDLFTQISKTTLERIQGATSPKGTISVATESL